MPDRLPTASATLAQAPRFPTAATNPAARAEHDRMANAIRALAMDAVEQAKSGHPGLPMGAADIVTVLFSRYLKFDPADPAWPDRDRFVLSAGHGSMLLYALLYLTGYQKMTIGEIKRFRQLGSLTPGHPEYGHTPGVETTTGPLGQGLANAVGMAIAERHLAALFGGDIVDHSTYVLASDGDLMEGISQEAIALAGHLKLRKLIVLFDDNGISIDGPLALADSVDQVQRFEAAGWAATRIDGHDASAIAAALDAAKKSDRPSLIACRTIIGFGAPTKGGTEKCHGSALGADEIAAARQKLGWSAPAFEIPPAILAQWRAAGERGRPARLAWQGRLAALDATKRAEFERRTRGKLAPQKLAAVVGAVKQKLAEAPKDIATRAASEFALEALTVALPEMVGGSADLTGSNNTRTKSMKVMSAADYSGRFIHYGVREHGMAAAMNGMALHGGIIPYSGTFLVFSDYCRPAIRLAALMRQRVIHVMTHDSIGLGEDGPTHQPVEHLAALRAMPNLKVFRPCDAVETVECWQLALESNSGPSVLALTRQNVPQLRKGVDNGNRCARGAYELIAAEDGAAAVSLFASGSEVAIAVAAQKLLAARKISARVVSVPCFELFLAAPDAERAAIIGNAKVNVAVEAGIRQGWDAIIGAAGTFVGMTGFGASAPYKELYQHFGITPEKVAEAALVRLRAS
ncbi:MAG TPA: transketolase [Xanthobacteraceae bacterium]|nr:transketolase [Xanthobacteraceae bacterium]